MEGPSVHIVANKLQFLKGQKILEVDGNARQPKYKLVEQIIDDVRAVKKRLFIDTKDVGAVIHFLMYGSYRVNERRENLDERLSLLCSSDEVNFYSCSVKVLEKEEDQYKSYDKPSQDVLSKDFNEERALKMILRDDRIIADVLLDQTIFGGVGNIIKNEVLFERKINPVTRASKLLKEAAKELVESAINWSKSWYRRKQFGEKKGLKIYRKSKCPNCNQKIKRKKLGKYDRITFICENCQA